MTYHVKKKKMLIPVFVIALMVVLAVSASANALCLICQGYNPVYCTGQETTEERTHYEHEILFIHWGGSCTYRTPTHWVATQCCNCDWGHHVYEDYTHPASWCQKFEEGFPCSEVPNWVMDP